MVMTIPKPEKIISRNGGSRGYGGGDYGSSGHGRLEPGGQSATRQIALWFFLVTVTMLFASVTSALMIRRAAGDWKPLFFPNLLWINTAILAASGVTLEVARRALHRLNSKTYRLWIMTTALLGIGFLCGQVMAWRQLAAHGIFLPTNPHSSFFYLFTGLHGLHLLGGIVALLLACRRAFQSDISVIAQAKSLKLTATYWHFMDALWIYLLFVLFVW